MERSGAIIATFTRVFRRRLASRVGAGGISKRGPTTVAVMLAKYARAMLECHYGVPMCGAVLNTAEHPPRRRRARLHARSCRGQGADRRSRISALMREALGLCQRRPLLICYDDPEYAGPGCEPSATSTMKRCWSRAASITHGRRRATNGTRYRSITPPAATGRSQRRRSITTAAPIYWRPAMFVTADMGRHPVYLWDAADVPLQTAGAFLVDSA